MISNTYNYSSHVTALQLLNGKSSNTSNNDGGSSTFVSSAGKLAGKAASSTLPAAKQHREALLFLSFVGFTASSNEVSNDLMKAFSDPKLQAEFNDKVEEEIAKARDKDHVIISDYVVRHRALTDVIMANRKMFPPEEFSFTTAYSDYTGTGTKSSTIPSVSDMAAQIFQDEVAKKQADYDADAAAKIAKPSPDGAKQDALEAAVRTLVLNDQDVVGDGVTDDKSAYAILIQKLYPDESDGGNHSAGQAAEPENNASANATTPA